MFKIRIKNINIPMYLGIYEWEKNHLRNVVLSLTIKTSEGTSQQRVCYDELCQYLGKYKYQNFDLIETLIDTIGNDLFASFISISSLKIKIKKGLTLHGQPTHVSIQKKLQR